MLSAVKCDTETDSGSARTSKQCDVTGVGSARTSKQCDVTGVGSARTSKQCDVTGVGSAQTSTVKLAESRPNTSQIPTFSRRQTIV